jgi:hypothetical protein
VRVVRLRGPAAAALAIALLALGGVFLVLGLALLATIGVAGGVAAAGYLAWRRLTGRGPVLPPATARHGLDPRMEVTPGETPPRPLPPRGE